MGELALLPEKIGIKFNNLSLLEQALVHSSFVNEKPVSSGSNERLEFLGDAILSCVVAEKLYRDYPNFTEGEMTKLRSGLVRRETLSIFAQTFKLGDYIYLGKGEEASGGRQKPANLAGALEAVIAAIYLDLGLDAARTFIHGFMNGELDRIIQKVSGMDYKSQLQEIIQSQEQLTPIYRLVEAIGPDHDKKFTVEVLAGNAILGTGSGRSKKLAEIEAARSALDHLHIFTA